MLASVTALLFLAGAAPAVPPIDPYCLKDVPWEVDASGPIRVFGCRPVGKIAAPDAQGWTTYTRPPQNGADGGFIRAKRDSVSAAGVWTIEVQDNGGGSGTFPFRVTGKPDATGVLAPATVKVTALPAH